MIKNKKTLHRTFVWFRFLLWWGSEVLSGTLAFSKIPGPAAHRFNGADMLFPASAWIFGKNGMYCMAMGKGCDEIKVIRMNDLTGN